jgi:peptide deformylase
MLTIVKDTVKSLRERSSPVELPLTVAYRKTLLNMLDYLKKSQDKEYAEKHKIREGVGLAAPQIGINKRMLVVHIPGTENTYVDYALVNPKIISSSVKKAYLSGGEGCLSVDGDHPGYIYRSNKVTINAFDVLQEKDIEIIAHGYEAIVLQHEIDHLDGILFYDRISKLEPLKKDENAIEI